MSKNTGINLYCSLFRRPEILTKQFFPRSYRVDHAFNAQAPCHVPISPLRNSNHLTPIKMATRRIVAGDKAILEKNDAPEKSDISPAVPKYVAFGP